LQRFQGLHQKKKINNDGADDDDGTKILSGYAKVSPWNEIALSATMQRKKE
jgi:hypothetical protein